jgi:hypothetical protein
MSIFIISHPRLFFSFFLIPLCGLVLSKKWSVVALYYTCFISTVLLFPVITGYTYAIDNLYAYLIYIVLSCLYGIVLKEKSRAILISITLSCVLAIALGCISVFYSALASRTTEREWERPGYKIRYVKDQGFVGAPIMTYEIYKYTTFPIFMKKVYAQIDNDTTESCIVRFELLKLSFNRCTGN